MNEHKKSCKEAWDYFFTANNGSQETVVLLKVYIYPTPPHDQHTTQAEFLRRVQQALIQSLFVFSPNLVAIPVEDLLYIVLALECCSHVSNYASRWIWHEHEEGKIICAYGRSTMRGWSSPLPGLWLAASPGVTMLAYIYTGPLMDIFLSASWTLAELLSR